MFFQSWGDFFNMGGYGFYVWLSYGISFLAIGILAVQSYREKHRIFADIRREQAREAGLKAHRQEKARGIYK
ncbi:heme exporter protein CcmD [Lonepinella koalarum]|uniref:heme exporter protein CcmD n=1 Tax=Lonepinella koalarum TaxID=53417 RepID=UPI0011E48E18|nr:heme exporter protein CcmD [Lonepinella koalarum]TYG35380.1 heme exporter protein CcmD [Lonepinella koalarum]